MSYNISNIAYISSRGRGKEAFLNDLKMGRANEGINFRDHNVNQSIFLPDSAKICESIIDQLLVNETYGASNIGIYHGTEYGNLEDAYKFDFRAAKRGANYVSPMKAPNTLANFSSGYIAILKNIQGPNFTINGGRISSLQVLDIALIHLEMGIIDQAVVLTSELSSEFHKLVFDNEPSIFGDLGVGISICKGNSQEKSGLGALHAVFSYSNRNVLTEIIIKIEEYIREFNLKEEEIKVVFSGGGILYESLPIKDSLKKRNLCPGEIIFLEEHYGTFQNSGGLYAIYESLVQSEIKNTIIFSIDEESIAGCLLTS